MDRRIRLLRLALRPAAVFALASLLSLAGGVTPADDGPAWSPSSVNCLSEGVGAPACSAGKMPGTLVDPERSGRHVGNPIEVASGNKYQRDVDFAAFASGLAFVRHYNSLLTDVNDGLGPGWRHSYQVSIARLNADTLRVTPADGRALHFTREAPGSGVYRGGTTASGEVIVAADSVRWRVADGRVFEFDRGWLSSIDFGDSRGQLRIARDGARVNAVTDSRGALLTLHWAERTALPDYDDPAGFWIPLGSLAAVTLPDGHRIDYRYDAGGRPSEIVYPDGERLSYRHEDGGLPALLVERQASWESGVRRWRYDGNGLAIHSSASGGVQIDRSAGPDAATVVWNDGRSDTAVATGPIDRPREEAPAPAAVAEPASPGPGTVRPHVATPRDDSLETLAKQIVQRVATDPESGLPTAVVALDERKITVELTTDRLGQIVEMRIGEVSGEMLLARLVVGELRRCGAEQAAISAGARLIALANGSPACRDDAITATALRDATQAVADAGRAGPLLKHRFATRIQHETVSILGPPPRPRGPAPPDPCMMPAGEDCDTLTDKHAMAQLSQCAYRSGTCDTGYRAVSAAAVDLENEDFHSGGFDAELYHDSRNDRYVVAFRGTDSVGDDWDANLRQGRGLTARQYDLAIDLADKLRERLPGREVVFTGHSLGGGLATAASLQAGSTATVFNAAAFHPDTAQAYGLADEFADAQGSIEVVRTYSDPISRGSAYAERYGIFGAQNAPGAHTVLADPRGAWADERTWAVPFNSLLVWHSIDSVIESLERLLERFCGLVR